MRCFLALPSPIPKMKTKKKRPDAFTLTPEAQNMRTFLVAEGLKNSLERMSKLPPLTLEEMRRQVQSHSAQRPKASG